MTIVRYKTIDHSHTVKGLQNKQNLIIMQCKQIHLLVSSLSHVFSMMISLWLGKVQPIWTLALLQSSPCRSCCCCCSSPCSRWWWWWWWWCFCCSCAFCCVSSFQVLLLIILEDRLSLRRCRRNGVLDKWNGANPKTTYRPGFGHFLWRNDEPRRTIIILTTMSKRASLKHLRNVFNNDIKLTYQGSIWHCGCIWKGTRFVRHQGFLIYK